MNIRHKPFKSVREHDNFCRRKLREKERDLERKPECIDDGKNIKLINFMVQND